MKKIIYTDSLGRLCVATPAINTHTAVDGEVVPVRENISEQEALDRMLARLPADAVNPQIVEALSIPSDRTFRDAWKAGDGKVEHDMAKAREIHKEKLRALRTPLIAALDVEYMRADEAGDSAKKAQIAAKKQALRDVTKDARIAAAATPEALKAIIPDALK